MYMLCQIAIYKDIKIIPEDKALLLGKIFLASKKKILSLYFHHPNKRGKCHKVTKK